MGGSGSEVVGVLATKIGKEKVSAAGLINEFVNELVNRLFWKFETLSSP